MPSRSHAVSAASQQWFGLRDASTQSTGQARTSICKQATGSVVVSANERALTSWTMHLMHDTECYYWRSCVLGRVEFTVHVSLE